jgi:peptidoglycan/LPS O-acetylase OafA/YrhL
MSSSPDPYLLTAVTPDRRHLPTLDGLRAVSITLVVTSHFASHLPGFPGVDAQFGVEIFFAISGFLIARLLLAEMLETGHLSLPAFYFRRALRLTPALAVFVAVMTCMMIAAGATDLRASACAMFYVTNYCVTEIGVMYDGPGVSLEGIWSLAVEEHFYLLFPLMLVALFRRDVRLLYAAVAAICAGALAFRIHYALADRPMFFLYWRSETAADMIMAGCVVSIMSAHDAGRAALRKVATPTFFAIATAIFAAAQIATTTGKLGVAFSQTAVAFWLAVLLVNLQMNPSFAGLRGLLNRRSVAWLGKISYSLYLWHFLVGFLAARFPVFLGYSGAVIAIVLSLALAAVSYYAIELPILARRGRLAALLGIGSRRAIQFEDTAARS